MSSLIEQARILFAQECTCVLAAADPEQFPESALPEIAFIGRSNVGKSSLINAVTGRNNLARASNTPGRTQQIVFFDLGNRLMLADLPGYGHADAPRAEKERWNDLTQHYLRQRRQLKCVCLLIDGRHGPKSNDLEMMDFLDRAAVTYKVILTKRDQARKSEGKGGVELIQSLITAHVAALDGALLSSSETKTGIEELRVFLSEFLATRP